jgi:hypothetical protein
LVIKKQQQWPGMERGDRGDRKALASQSPSSGDQFHETGANQKLFSGFRKTVSELLFYTPVDEAVVNKG